MTTLLFLAYFCLTLWLYITREPINREVNFLARRVWGWLQKTADDVGQRLQKGRSRRTSTRRISRRNR